MKSFFENQKNEARLNARPNLHIEPLPFRGVHSPDLFPQKDPLIFIPESYQPGNPAPVVIVLHGAGGTGEGTLPLLRDFAETQGMILIVPTSVSSSWDVIRGGFGPDVERLDQTLQYVFKHLSVDPAHIAIAGFSDGASYALTLGVTNGDLFTHVIAFSPGFMAHPTRIGRPEIFISHGTNDTILPIDRCSRRIVPELREKDYPLQYHEFQGGHTIPLSTAQQAIQWFMADFLYPTEHVQRE